jgi:hypothetical protein
MHQGWPGNIRELETISADDVKESLLSMTAGKRLQTASSINPWCKALIYSP